MQEQLISFETAKLAKEKGFKENCTHLYNNEILEEKNCIGFVINIDGINNLITAPTQSLLQKWLRETHKIHVWCSYQEKGYFINIDTKELNGWYREYEEALENGLRMGLKHFI